MMKLAFPVQIAALTTITLTSIICSYRPASAIDYGELEVEQNQFVAVAVPFGNGQYNFMVIEQIAGQQKCWSESGSQPVTVEPLLLNFDFSGSCRRATDSNGYSIRMSGQDYGLNYLLSIVERDGELLLVGIPRSGEPNLSEVIVGRSYGISQGLLKILLNPGWRFTKRTFAEKTLGHVYLTGDRMAMNSSGIATADTIPNQVTKAREVTYSVPDTNFQTLPSNSTQSSYQPQKKSPEVVFVTDYSANKPKMNNHPDSYVDKLLVPDVPIPVSTQVNFSSTSVASQLPAESYRVIVEVSNSSQESQVRSLYPEAFSTVYQGKSMLQVGSFSQRQNAESTFQNIQNLGWEGMILDK